MTLRFAQPLQWLADKRAVFAGLQKGSAAVSETLDQEEQIRDVVLPQQV